MVYRGGLENRFGVTPNGGSNPSLSASLGGSAAEYEGCRADDMVKLERCELRLGKPE